MKKYLKHDMKVFTSQTQKFFEYKKIFYTLFPKAQVVVVVINSQKNDDIQIRVFSRVIIVYFF